jgi:serine/threonine protein kinase
VAIKVIEKTSIARTREISLLRQMHHPFVTELFQALDDDTNHSLVMEFVEHGNMLDDVNLNGRVNEDQGRRFFAQQIWVLEYLHFDLKCENVFLDHEDDPQGARAADQHQYNQKPPGSHSLSTSQCCPGRWRSGNRRASRPDQTHPTKRHSLSECKFHFFAPFNVERGVNRTE